MLWNGMIMLLVVMIQKLFVNSYTRGVRKVKKDCNAKKMYTQGTRTYKKMMWFVSCYGEYKRKSEMSKHLKDLDRENNELLKSS